MFNRPYFEGLVPFAIAAQRLSWTLSWTLSWDAILGRYLGGGSLENVGRCTGEAMSKAIVALSVAAGAVMAAGTAARAEVITYRCSAPSSAATYHIDTQTRLVQWDGQGTGTLQGNDAYFVMTFTSPQPRSMALDRKTGRTLDSGGDIGTCQLVK